MEQNKVDLSKAKAGDTVVFRCGGKAVIRSIGTNDVEADEKPIYNVWFEKDTGYRTYDETGSYTLCAEPSIVDITEVIPAPVAFDWKDAKWGDAFIDTTSNKKAVLYYVGKHHCSRYAVFLDKRYNSRVAIKEFLTRCPEHDIKEGCDELLQRVQS